MANIASEPWTGFSPERWTAFRSESPAGFIGIRTLEQALHDRRLAKGSGLIHHSDRESQYVAIRYTERLTEAGVEPSVGSVGDCGACPRAGEAGPGGQRLGRDP